MDWSTARTTLCTTALALCATVVPARPAHAQSAPASLEARLQRMQDIEEIRDVLIAYGRSLDTRDLETYANLFSHDGEWVGGFGTVTGGPPAILAFMRSNIRQTGTQPPASYHVMSNFLIDVHGDTATAWSRWTFVSAGAGNTPAVSQGGRYEDDLVRENSHWKIRHRLVTREVPRRTAPPAGSPSTGAQK